MREAHEHRRGVRRLVPAHEHLHARVREPAGRHGALERLEAELALAPLARAAVRLVAAGARPPPLPHKHVLVLLRVPFKLPRHRVGKLEHGLESREALRAVRVHHLQTRIEQLAVVVQRLLQLVRRHALLGRPACKRVEQTQQRRPELHARDELEPVAALARHLGTATRQAERPRLEPCGNQGEGPRRLAAARAAARLLAARGTRPPREKVLEKEARELHRLAPCEVQVAHPLALRVNVPQIGLQQEGKGAVLHEAVAPALHERVRRRGEPLPQVRAAAALRGGLAPVDLAPRLVGDGLLELRHRAHQGRRLPRHAQGAVLRGKLDRCAEARVPRARETLHVLPPVAVLGVERGEQRPRGRRARLAGAGALRGVVGRRGRREPLRVCADVDVVEAVGHHGHPCLVLLRVRVGREHAQRVQRVALVQLRDERTLQRRIRKHVGAAPCAHDGVLDRKQVAEQVQAHADHAHVPLRAVRARARERREQHVPHHARQHGAAGKSCLLGSHPQHTRLVLDLCGLQLREPRDAVLVLVARHHVAHLGVEVDRPGERGDQLRARQGNLAPALVRAGAVQQDRNQVVLQHAQRGEHTRDGPRRVRVVLAPEPPQVAQAAKAVVAEPVHELELAVPIIHMLVPAERRTYVQDRRAQQLEVLFVVRQLLAATRRSRVVIVRAVRGAGAVGAERLAV